MRISACQMVSGRDPEANVVRAVNLISASAESGADLVVLPENFALFSAEPRETVAAGEVWGDGPIQEAVRMAAERCGVWVAAGSVPIRTEDPDRVALSLIVYSPDGKTAARYDRMHCFAYDPGAGERVDESNMMVPGRSPASFRLTTWDGLELRVGLAMGFDLRFPELFRSFGTVDLVLLPACFTETTGRAHWETLVAARAIENQCYIAAAAQSGAHECGRRTWGHSRIVDPWGTTVSGLAAGEGLVLADFDERRLAAVRRMLPALEARRIF